MRCRFKHILPIAFLILTSWRAMAEERFQPTWESLKKYQTPDWFRDAKFGIFILWGVYSVPAFGSEWYSSQMYRKDWKERSKDSDVSENAVA